MAVCSGLVQYRGGRPVAGGGATGSSQPGNWCQFSLHLSAGAFLTCAPTHVRLGPAPRRASHLMCRFRVRWPLARTLDQVTDRSDEKTDTFTDTLREEPTGQLRTDNRQAP